MALRISALMPGGLGQKMGFKKGDIIESVNGVPATDPDMPVTVPATIIISRPTINRRLEIQVGR